MTFLKNVGINYASRFIPIMCDTLESFTSKWKSGEELNMSREASLLTFDIICKILFGQDLHEQLELCQYTNPKTGETSTLEMHDALEKISLDCSFAALVPYNVIFPWLVKYDVGKLNSTNTKNGDDFIRVIKNFLETTKDKDSVYYKVLREASELDKQEVFSDVMSFMFGGHETNSRALSTSLLYLKRQPELRVKIAKEIEDKIFMNGKFTLKNMKEILSNDALDDCQELSNFIKEVLRFVPPASRSLGYITTKQIEFTNGVIVPKG